MSSNINRKTTILIDSKRVDIVNDYLTVIKTYDDCPYTISRTITIRPAPYICSIEEININDAFESCVKSVTDVEYV